MSFVLLAVEHVTAVDDHVMDDHALQEVAGGNGHSVGRF
jgi:hypothetical protein